MNSSAIFMLQGQERTRERTVHYRWPFVKKHDNLVYESHKEPQTSTQGTDSLLTAGDLKTFDAHLNTSEQLHESTGRPVTSAVEDVDEIRGA